MKKHNKNKQYYGRSPSKLVYGIIYHILKPILVKTFNIKFNIDPAISNLQGPVLILGNHPSNIDPFITAIAIYPKLINFLVASSFFKNPFFRFLLKQVGAIPKTQFRADPSSVKAMFKVLNNNAILGVFPEGARSIDGTLMSVEDTIAKFIKKTSPNLVVSKLHGAYLSWPRWSRYKVRKGKVELELKIIATSNEIESIEPDKLKNLILSSLNYDEFVWQKKEKIIFKNADTALGMEQVLHKCPRCQANWALKTKKNKIFCSNCSNTALVNNYVEFYKENQDSVIFKNISEWNNWQKNTFIKENDEIYIGDNCKYYVSYMNEKFKFSGRGVVLLDNKTLSFTGRHRRKEIVKKLPISGVLGISAQFGKYFEIFQEKYTYKFVLENGQKVIGFTHALEAIKKDNNKLLQGD